jgi:hypothetical protein
MIIKPRIHYKTIGCGGIALSMAACSLLSGDIQETNELGEWVVAKPQTFRYKSYVADETETIKGLEAIVAKKQRYYDDCLQGKVRSGYIGGKSVEYTETCSKDYDNRELHRFYTRPTLTLNEALKRLSIAKRIVANDYTVSYAAKAVVWRGISKELSKSEEKIKDREYWCLNPSLPKNEIDDWKKLLGRSFGTDEDSSDPDTKMYERLQKRICEFAWRKPSGTN